MATSKEHDEQNLSSFWESVTASFRDQPEADEVRTGESLRFRFGTLQRLVQKYLASERLYLAKEVSGETQDEIAANILRFFRVRTRTRDRKGNYKDGPVLRSMGAVDVLRRIPKFGGKASGTVDSGSSPRTPEDPGVNSGNESPSAAVEAAAGAGALAPIQVSKYRPIGVKKAKHKSTGQRAGNNNVLAALTGAMKEKA